MANYMFHFLPYSWSSSELWTMEEAYFIIITNIIIFIGVFF